jgi:hypothetical protein
MMQLRHESTQSERNFSAEKDSKCIDDSNSTSQKDEDYLKRLSQPKTLDSCSLKSSSFSTSASGRCSFLGLNFNNTDVIMENEQPFQVTKAIREMNLDSTTKEPDDSV